MGIVGTKRIKPLVELKRCTKCVLPETFARVDFDENGVCSMCRHIHQKEKLIDWKARETQLIQLLGDAKKKAKENGSPWDCVIASSGGKDSTYQAYILKTKYGMKPISCTYNGFGAPDNWIHQHETTCGKIGIEHILFTPRKDLVAHIAHKGLELEGDECMHCHLGCFTFLWDFALKYGIPMVVFGPPPAEEMGAYGYHDCSRITKDLIKFTGEGHTVEDLVGDGYTLEDLHQWALPPDEEFNKVMGIWLGHYLKWDVKKHMEIVKKECGWREWEVPDNESTWHHIDCKYCGDSGVREYTKYLKRGFNRFAQDLSHEIRAGKMTREAALKETLEKEGRVPTLLNEYLELIDMTEDEFYRAVSKHVVKPWKFPIEGYE